VVISAVVVILIAVAVTVWSGQRKQSDTPALATNLEQLDVYGQVPPFSLIERSGRHVGRDDLRGLVWVATFIYTECTETCPTQSSQLARLRKEFAATADLRLVSITVDPRNDTPPVLRAYAERYGATDEWWFLSGDTREIYCLAREGFRLSVIDPSASGPVTCATTLRFGPAAAWASHGSQGLIMHSARLVLVDRGGRIRAYHRADDAASLDRLRINLRRVLAERPTLTRDSR
jgi:protein SCO1/2